LLRTTWASTSSFQVLGHSSDHRHQPILVHYGTRLILPCHTVLASAVSSSSIFVIVSPERSFSGFVHVDSDTPYRKPYGPYQASHMPLHSWISPRAPYLIIRATFLQVFNRIRFPASRTRWRTRKFAKFQMVAPNLGQLLTFFADVTRTVPNSSTLAAVPRRSIPSSE
jgi:hypothetical protein